MQTLSESRLDLEFGFCLRGGVFHCAHLLRHGDLRHVLFSLLLFLFHGRDGLLQFP